MKNNNKKKLKKEKIKIKYYSTLRKCESISNEVLENIDNYKKFTKKDFLNKTKEFKQRLKEGSSLDDILVEAFAVAFNAIKKIYDISLYKVQIMGSYALHLGDVAEMKTGEGKTLTAILPAYLNSLNGEGVHVVTVNEYLSKRDSYNVSKIFSLLGVSVGNIESNMDPQAKKEEYKKDIIYITNSELGFDYLKDNLVSEISEKVQRKFNFAIIDEVDSILIDESRTPLIISGGQSYETLDYRKVNEFTKGLKISDYEVDKEGRQCFLTDEGILKAQDFFKIKNLYSYKFSRLVHLIFNSLQANYIQKLDVDYTVKDEEIVLIDSFTGRLLEGRQFSEGLNQAIEAKENLKIKPETKTVASITYQNIFRMYKKLSGMSGTAITEEEEFLEVYNMRVLQIPTNLPIIRKDLPDILFATKKAKYKSIIEKVKSINEKGQPILLGTNSVNESEEISKLLNEINLKHEVLNAKNNSREAEIIKSAGIKDQITIATNMAGRGTDIKLGEGVIELGGLFVLGTERNESRRIDDQLRGRSGRQGDIGYSQFYVSLEDSILQRSGLKRIQKAFKFIDEQPIKSKYLQNALTLSQKKIESLNYDYRKNVLEYDDVLNNQRIIVYKQRDSILTSLGLESIFLQNIETFLKNESKDQKNFSNSNFDSKKYFENIKTSFKFLTKIENEDQELTTNEAIAILKDKLNLVLSEKIKNWKKNQFQYLRFIQGILIWNLDSGWRNQIDLLEKLKTGIFYRQYAQINPVQVYVQESNKLFNIFKKEMVENNVKMILNIDPTKDLHISEKIKKEKKEVKEITVR